MFSFKNCGCGQLASDLGELLDFVRQILRAEVLKEPLAPLTLMGMNGDEIRARSHHPKKYYNIDHFAPVSIEDGGAVLMLNSLRTLSREVELCAYKAFRGENGKPEREDICRSLNRISSALYVMMLRVKVKEYQL
jgi:ethanolamine utilization cobalamin adenosyltransferase